MPSEIVFSANTYAGSFARNYVSQALLGSISLQRELLKVIPNIKKKRILRSFEQDVHFQNASCAFNSSGNTVLGERALSPIEMSVMFEICFGQLQESWEAELLNAGAGKEQIPADLGQFLIQRMNAKINAGIEKLIWMGKTSDDFQFDAAFPGLIALASNDSNTKKLSPQGSLAITGISIAANAVVTVASTANLKTGDWVSITGANAATLVNGAAISGQSFQITVINATTFQLNTTTTGTATGSAGFVHFVNRSNIIDVLTTIYNATPDAIKHSEDYFIAIPMHIADAYRLHLASMATGSGAYFTGDKPLNFLGKELVEMPHFAFNTIMATRKSNLFFGTDLLSDFNSVQVLDMRNTTADEKVRYRSNFALDVNYAFGEEIVLYRA